MNLFTFENYELNIAPEAYTLEPFKAIIDKYGNTKKGRQQAQDEFAFIYFFCDIRSDYMYLNDDNERMEAIINDTGMDPNWRPDETTEKAIEFYNSFKSTAALLLEDTRHAIGKLRQILRNINLEETDDSGRPIYTLNVITNTIKQIPNLVKDLDEAERSLAKEMADNSKIRGGKEPTVFENGFSF